MIKQNDKNGLTYLFAAFLSLDLLPYMMHSTILMVTGKCLSEAVYLLCNGAGVVVCFLFLLLAFLSMGYRNIRSCIITETIILFTGLFSKMAGDFIVKNITVRFVQHIPVVVAIYGIYALICLGLLTYALMNGMRKVKDMLLVMIMWVGAAVVYEGIMAVLKIAAGIIRPSFAANVAFFMVVAAIEAVIVYFICRFIRKKTNNWEEKEASFVKRVVPFAAGILVLIVIAVIDTVSDKPEKVICMDIEDDIAKGSIEIAVGNVDMALKYYERALNRIDAWTYIAKGESTGSSLYNASTDTKDLQLSVMSWENNHNISAMENYLIYEDCNMELAKKLLDLYQDMEVLDEQQEKIQEDIIRLMIAKKDFCNDALSLTDIEGKEEKLLKKLEQYETVYEYYDILSVVAETGKSGKITEQQVNKILDYADKYNTDINMQYLAISYGISFKGDNASHYARTINAVRRYVTLYEKLPEVTQEDIENCKIMAAQWVMEIGDYDTAIYYLKPIAEKSQNVNAIILLMNCYEKTGDMENCRKMAEELLEYMSDNSSALYYCAVTYLKEKDYDKVIEYTTKLCEVVEQAEGEEKQKAEVALYSMLQYMIISDVSCTDYQYSMYKNLSEEQRKSIEKNKLFDSYIQAVYYCFGSKDYEKALKETQNVIKAEGEMAQILYLEGCIYYGMEDFKKAEECFKKSVAIEYESPTAWYALANAYDAQGKYEEAYDACLKVDLLLPETDHKFDWYGVSIHNNRLLSELKNILGR